MPLYGTAAKQATVADAPGYGVDPYAAEAVADPEGGWGGAVGDAGKSYGPWQMHIGGELPNTIAALPYAQRVQWANSREGIDYALSRMGKVAGGTTGDTAIRRIIAFFERPGDLPLPPSVSGAGQTRDYRIASQRYQVYAASGGGGQPESSAGGAGGTAQNVGFNWNQLIPGWGIVPGIGPPNSIQSGLGWIERFFGFLFSYRFIELLGGGALLLLGLALLARRFGSIPQLQQLQIVGSAASAADAAAPA